MSESSDQPLNILAMETSTQACSVALTVGNEIKQLYEEGHNLHSRVLLKMVDQLLAENNLVLAEIDYLVAGIGPGAFTGLRIGVGVAQGLAYSHHIPVVGVTSLAALAQSIATPEDAFIFVGLDARMSEVYWAGFSKSGVNSLELTVPYQLSSPSTISSDHVDSAVSNVFVGNAWSIYAEQFPAALQQCMESGVVIEALPQAQFLLKYARHQGLLNDTGDVATISPLYLRNNVAKKKTTNPLVKN